MSSYGRKIGGGNKPQPYKRADGEYAESDAIEKESGDTPAEERRVEEVLSESDEMGLTSGQDSGKIGVATTIEEAAQIAVEAGIAEQADYTGISVETANEINSLLAERMKEYPIVEQFGFVGNGRSWQKAVKPEVVRVTTERVETLCPDEPQAEKQAVIDYNVKRQMREFSISRSTVAFYYSGESFGLGGILYNKNNISNTEDHKAQVKSGFHPKGTGSVRGIIDHEFGHALYDKLKLGSCKEMYAIYRRERSNIATGLSRYAAQKGFEEFVAEAFSEYKNSAEPRKIATAVGELIDKLAKGDK